jgi:enterochelin esterase-like enzyme
MAKILVAVALVAGAVVTGSALSAGPDQRGAAVRHFTVKSRLVGRSLDEIGIVPAGVAAGERRPLLVFLHGRGMRPDSLLSDQFFAGLARLGTRAPIVVALNGGNHSYWHDRSDGRWGSYVRREAIPAAVRLLGADPKRVAIGGISMGGYGAFEIARRARPGRFCAIGGHSPAFWLSSGQTAPGAFDDAADFARHDVVGAARRSPRSFAGTPLWIDAGTGDPFDPGDRAFYGALRAARVPIAVHRWPGGHDGDYWSAHWPAYLSFYAHACA